MIFPYITFAGNCREALAFYGDAFGCEPQNVMPYGEYIPEGLDNVPEGLAEYILHAELTISGTNVTLADEVLQDVVAGTNMKFMVTLADKSIAENVFGKLASGGRVTLEPVETFYSTFHAAVVDKYGVNWNIVAEEAPH